MCPRCAPILQKWCRVRDLNPRPSDCKPRLLCPRCAPNWGGVQDRATAMERDLDDAWSRTLKPPAEGRLEVRDSRVAGLVLRMTAAGAATWSIRARTKDGKQTRPKLGACPAWASPMPARPPRRRWPAHPQPLKPPPPMPSDRSEHRGLHRFGAPRHPVEKLERSGRARDASSCGPCYGGPRRRWESHIEPTRKQDRQVRSPWISKAFCTGGHSRNLHVATSKGHRHRLASAPTKVESESHRPFFATSVLSRRLRGHGPIHLIAVGYHLLHVGPLAHPLLHLPPHLSAVGHLLLHGHAGHGVSLHALRRRGSPCGRRRTGVPLRRAGRKSCRQHHCEHRATAGLRSCHCHFLR